MAINISEIKPPEGYRFLNYGEIIKKDDLFYRAFVLKNYDTHWTSVKGYGVVGTSNPRRWKIITKIIKKIKYSQKEIDYILNKLKKVRAFNQDSAIKVTEKNKDFLLYYTLSQDGVIGVINNNRFYNKEQYEPKPKL